MLLKPGMNKNYLHTYLTHIENVSVLWQSNITKGQQEKLESLFEIETAFHILVMNVEALSTEKGVKFAY